MVPCRYIVLDRNHRVLTPHSISFRSGGLHLYFPHNTLHIRIIRHSASCNGGCHCDAATGVSGAFVKLRKATVSFVMSVRPYGTSRLPPDGFS